MADADAEARFFKALQTVDGQIGALNALAGGFVATVTGDSITAAAAAAQLQAARDAIAVQWNTGDPDKQAAALLAMEQLAAGSQQVVSNANAPLNPAGAAYDALTSDTGIVTLLIVGAIVYLVVEHEEGR